MSVLMLIFGLGRSKLVGKSSLEVPAKPLNVQTLDGARRQKSSKKSARNLSQKICRNLSAQIAKKSRHLRSQRSLRSEACPLKLDFLLIYDDFGRNFKESDRFLIEGCLDLLAKRERLDFGRFFDVELLSNNWASEARS